MQINLNKIDTEQFIIKESFLNGVKLFLVTPQHIGCKWNKANLIFRSSVWDIDGNPISLGYKKFGNIGENPDVFGLPTDLRKSFIVDKEDGSCKIVSKFRGEYIIRTRGTFDATQLHNGHEVQLFKDYILSNYDDDSDTWNYSLIFEWYSPENIVVINYGENPQWFFTGKIYHDGYQLENQNELDNIAQKYNWQRPRSHYFNSMYDLSNDVLDWQDKEGVCIYIGQSIYKLKSNVYKKLHAFKENANFDSVLDLYLSYGMPDYKNFESVIINNFDWECYQMVRGFVSQICDAKKEVDKIVNGMNNFVHKIRAYDTRKEQAIAITGSYGDSGRASMLFSLLDGKELTIDNYKKLFFQVTKS